MTKRKKSSYRLVPPEFENMPTDKEELVKRIAAQRERLIEERELVVKRSLTSKSQPTRLTGKQKTFPRSNTMRLVLKNPALSLVVGVAAVVAIPLLMRRIGAKQLLRGFNIASPLMMHYLGSKGHAFTEQEEYEDQEEQDDQA